MRGALEQGARLFTPDAYVEGSALYPPSVLIDVISSMPVTREEIFSPAVAISTFETEDEALRLANATNTGLAGYIFTVNVSRLFRVAGALKVGMVGVRTGSVSAIEQPFGSIKDSGLGTEGRDTQ